MHRNHILKGGVRIIKNALIRIKENMDNLNPTEKKLAKYIVDQPDEVINYSVQKLAGLSNVSEATIVRFSKKMKFKGFQDLKLQIAYDLNKPQSPKSSYQDITADVSTKSLIESVSHNNVKSIQDTLLIVSEITLEKSIEMVNQARKIAVFGIGASAIIAQDMKQKLTRIDRWTEIGTDFDTQATISANLNEKDVVIGISNSGKTQDIIQSLTIAKENKAQIISITRYGDNAVSNLADAKLSVSSPENIIRSGAMSSRIAMLNVIDILYTGIARNDYERNIQMLEKTRKAVKISKTK